jgi:TOMM system kinase/cyclase fusion protein
METTDDSPLVAGSIFQGGYEILAELAQGSFGRVYEARQLSTGQRVAIKTQRGVWRDLADFANARERFRREMRLCAELAHPNIVRLIDSGETPEGRLYAVFEYVPGFTLKDVLSVEGKLSLGETLHLMSQVLDALSAAHARGIVHRDLKPANIMITKTGARRNALVLDFGLSGLFQRFPDRELPKLTASYELMGTPCYAAPEQLRGEAPSTRSDLYSWGLVVLECLTGELAVGGASTQEVILKQMSAQPIAVPDWLRSSRLGRILETVTAKRLEKRDATAEGVLELLGQLDVGGPSAATRQREAADAERRQLTVLCCRFTISAAQRTGGLEPEKLDEVLRAQRAVCAELAARDGGRITGFFADRMWIVFGYPQAREEDARRAVRTALRIIEDLERANARPEADHLVEVRIGAHTGLVVVREPQHEVRDGPGDLVGGTPQVAAALAELAAPGQVLASEDTLRLLRGEMRCDPAGRLPVPHLSRDLIFFRVSSAAGDARREVAEPARETPLVGRARQLNELHETWARVERGSPAAVLLRGEPGIGKSRLVRELRRQVPGEAWMEARCLVENRSTPLRPFVETLAAVREPLESLLARCGFDLPTTIPLFDSLLARPPDKRYPRLVLSAERQKELTLHALLTLLLRASEARPLVVVIEDIQWADPTTLEVITALVQELRATAVTGAPASTRLCVLLTARQEFDPPWSGDDVTTIQLARLDAGEVATMVTDALAHARPLPDTMLDEIVRRADGIPLFVEEVTRTLVETAAAAPGTRSSARSRAGSFEIPSGLRDLLTARLDRLSSSARETAQLAAVLGREFRYEVVRAISRRDEAGLREDLIELGAAGLVFHRRGSRAESYLFKHVLMRDAAYESLVRAARENLHLRVANVLRQRFPEVEAVQPEILAQHFEAGGEPLTAGEYYRRAGDRAFKRAAYIEATAQLERGTEIVQAARDSPARDRAEVELLTSLGTVYFATRGHAAGEVERTFSRAHQLCVTLGEEPSGKVLAGIASVYIARSDRAAVEALLPRFQSLARRSHDVVASITGHAVLGSVDFWSGDFVGALEHLAAARRYYGTDEFKRFAMDYGYDGGFFVYPFSMCSLWNLGYPDQAEALRRESLQAAEASGNLYSILIALGFAATQANDLGDPDTAAELADRIIALAADQRLFFWTAIGNLEHGGALLQRGQTDDAIARITQGLDVCRLAGLLASYHYYLTYLAAAYVQAGRVQEGLSVVAEGLAHCETGLSRFYASELHRLHGDLMRLAGDQPAAEASYRRALDVARAQRARTRELHAATSLSRLLRDTRQTAEARTVLTDVYGWFSEGFETRDLREAKATLATLG